MLQSHHPPQCAPVLRPLRRSLVVELTHVLPYVLRLQIPPLPPVPPLPPPALLPLLLLLLLLLLLASLSSSFAAAGSPSMIPARQPGNGPSSPLSASPSVESDSNFQTSHCVPGVNPRPELEGTNWPRYDAATREASGSRETRAQK